MTVPATADLREIGPHLRILNSEGLWKAVVNRDLFNRVFIWHQCKQPKGPSMEAWGEECWGCKEKVPSGVAAAALIAVMALS